MIGRYRRRIIDIAKNLRRLEGDIGNLDLLISLQQELLAKIIHIESRIALLREASGQLKGQLKTERLAKDQARALKNKIRRHAFVIADYRHLIFIFKCFGDGIAFVYLDKYALKHVYCSTSDYRVKQDSGGISGKIGLAAELAALEKLKLLGVPALLCDITNTIRHGDICVLIGPDPLPIEIKSSIQRNPRSLRQQDSIDTLIKFLATDEAVNFRGAPKIMRRAFSKPERNHFAALSTCIERSLMDRVSTIKPEPGLQYSCSSAGADQGRLLECFSAADGIICFVNEAKSTQSWPPLYPFTLSIREPEHLYEFVAGRLALIVELDLAEVRKLFHRHGIEVVFAPGETWPVWMRQRNTSHMHALSHQILARLFHEFQSLRWFVSQQAELGRIIQAEAEDFAVGSDAGQTSNAAMDQPPPWVDELFDRHYPKSVKARAKQV